MNHNWQAVFFSENVNAPKGIKKRGPPREAEERIPLVVTNKCDSTIWPGVATQSGTGPGIGRVWGRTNCTVNGESCACKTGDCFAKLDCEFSGATPATLAEFNLAGGVDNKQTFYDISLVDGYNIPMGIKYIPAKNTTFIPPNLTNCACIATAGWVYSPAGNGTFYSNATYPIPLESEETNESVSAWCPWLNLAFPPTEPGNGIYPYPDDNVQRPAFAPCNSACAATGTDKDCCIGKYHDPNICKPSQYSKSVKAVCPDAYSFAFDDQTSTFIIPKGGGWEVVMCPEGRSTDILRKLGPEMFELASGGKLSTLSLKRLQNATYVRAERGDAGLARPWVAMLVLGFVVAAYNWACL
ncbi:Osmotin, thaumatin-like protein [Trichoderma gracile]